MGGWVGWGVGVGGGCRLLSFLLFAPLMGDEMTFMQSNSIFKGMTKVPAVVCCCCLPLFFPFLLGWKERCVHMHGPRSFKPHPSQQTVDVAFVHFFPDIFTHLVHECSWHDHAPRVASKGGIWVPGPWSFWLRGGTATSASSSTPMMSNALRSPTVGQWDGDTCHAQLTQHSNWLAPASVCTPEHTQ